MANCDSLHAKAPFWLPADTLPVNRSFFYTPNLSSGRLVRDMHHCHPHERSDAGDLPTLAHGQNQSSPRYSSSAPVRLWASLQGPKPRKGPPVPWLCGFIGNVSILWFWAALTAAPASHGSLYRPSYGNPPPWDSPGTGRGSVLPPSARLRGR